MRTWQEIFAEKVADLKLMDPWMLQEDDSLEVHNTKSGWKKFVPNHVSGRFQCSQCLHEWSSAKVHIIFHMCWGTVRMRIFRQACRRCHVPQLEEPEFGLENVERLLHNLVLKILEDFYDVPMQPSDLLEVVVDVPVAGPHDRDRCEGYQLGICSRPRAAPEPAAWKPRVDMDKAWKPMVDVVKAWKPTADVGKAQKPKADKGKARKARAGTGKARSDHTETPLIPSSSEQALGSGFPWKRCCCVGFSVLCVLAVLLFILLYFLMK